MRVIFLMKRRTKEEPHLLGWMEVEEGQEFDCPECLARHKVVGGEIVRLIYDDPCSHTSWSVKEDGTIVVYFTRYIEEIGEEELAKQKIDPGQLGRVLGYLSWIEDTFPRVLEKLKEAEELWDKMDDPKIYEKVKNAVQDARISINTLVTGLQKILDDIRALREIWFAK
jgi:hypothetical protein